MMDLRLKELDIFLVAGPFHVVDRADNVAANLGGSGHTSEEVYHLLRNRYQLGDRLALSGYYDRTALLRDLIEKAQAIRLEIGYRDLRDIVVIVFDPRSFSANHRVADGLAVHRVRLPQLLPCHTGEGRYLPPQ